MLQPKRPNISNKSKKKLFQLQGETNLVQKDNIPNTKRDLSLMLAEYNNAKKDKQELRTTGQIKNPNSIQYRRNIKTQPDIKQDNISAEQRNAPLNPLQRPLIYLANPEKVLGDLGVPGMETSELDRQTINANKFNPYQSRTDRFLNNAKIGLGYVPEATVNTAMAAAFMPEGSGALGLVNETLNPLAGIKTSIPDSMKQGFNSQGFLDMFKSKFKLEPKFNSEINWGKINKEITENPQLIKEYNAIEQTSKANNTWMKNPDGSKFEGIPEEFVKVNSQNFKNAYPNGYGTTYRGQKEASDVISGGTRGYNSSVFTGDLEQAKTYATNWKEPIYKKGITTSSDEGGTSLNKLVFPQTNESSILKINAKGANWDKIENTEIWNSLPEYERNFRIEEGNFNVTTDDIAKYMEDKAYTRAEIKNVIDNGGGVSKKMLGKDKTSNTVINNNIQGNYLKSILGNNGMFDMNNPNIYKSIIPIAGASYLATQGQEESKKFQQGGYINQNNMSRYTQGGDLTQFNEGGTHEQSPIGGVPIGNNNSVEQGETKQGNFVYSNRIFLDSNIVSQYNLPKSLVGKSVADATKFIDNKFKGRNDKISQSTKNGMLSKIAEAQEAMKPAEPEMEQSQEGMIDPTQMALGGYVNRQMEDGGYYDQNNPYFMQNPGVQQPGIGPMNQIQPVSQLSQANSLSQIKPFSTGNQLPTASAVPDTAGAIGGGLKEMSGKTGLGLSSALGAASTAIDLGKTAFGKPAQDTSGLAPSAKVNSGGMIAGSAMKGASAGMAFGPLGAGIGTVVGGVAGLLGSGKAKKAALKNSNNFARRTNAQFSDQYAMGGKMKQYALGGEEGTLSDDVITQQLAMAYKTGNPVNAVYGNNSNPINNVQKGLGLVPGKWGPKSMATLSKYQKENKLAVDGKYGPETFKSMGLTPGGRQYIESVNNLKPIETITPYTISAQPKINNEQLINVNNSENPSFGKKVWDGTKSTGKFLNDNAGNISRYAPIAANALQLSQLKKPQGERLDRLGNRYKPEYVDEAMIRNIVDQEANNQINALTQSGASQGAVRNAILGAGLNKTKALSDAYSNAAAQNRATNDRAQTFNLGVDQVNLQQSNTEKENFAKDQAAYRNAKREYITGIGEGIGDIGKEQTYKKIIAKTTGYKWDGEYVKSPDGTVVTDPTTGKPMTEEKLKEIQSIKDKKALGGYLIKNKVK